MADENIGRGVIELVADARKLRAGIEEAKKQVRGLADDQTKAGKRAAQSIEQYIGKLQQQNATFGKSVRETELYKLAIRGATQQQIRSADAALLIAERNKRMAESFDNVRRNAIRAGAVIGAAIVAGTVAAVVAFEKLIDSTAKFQDIAEKTGDSAENIASLAVAAAGGGTSIDVITQASARLAKNLSEVNEESSDTRAALQALGINIQQFQQMKTADQFSALATAMGQFQDSAEKSAVAQALFGRAGAELLPFLKELESGIGRQNILTEEQIRLADSYKDRQAVLIAQTQLYAQQIAVQMLPAVSDLIEAFLDVVKATIGAGNATDELGRNRGLQDFADGAVRAVAVIIDQLVAVSRAFEVAGRIIYGFGAAAASALQLDLSTARSEIESTAKAIEEIRNRPSLVAALDARIADRRRPRTLEDEEDLEGRRSPKQLRFTGGGRSKKGPKDNSAEQEAKAQLQFDLDQIRKAGDAAVSEFERAQRILEARRSANLVGDREYYAAKQAFIELNSRAQAQAIEQEIALLQKQTFAGKNAGKERIDNDRKIADAQAKLASVRANAVASIEINSIQEAAANERVRQSYLDAVEAADAYIDSIRRRNQAEIAGIGRGNQFREQQAGRQDIDERFDQQRRKLEGELRRGQITQDVFDTYLQAAANAYSKEVSLYDERTAAIRAAEANWLNGATEALANYADESRNVAKQTEEVFTNAFQAAEDALTKFLDTGKLDVKAFAASIASDLNRAFVRQNILGPLSESLFGNLSKSGGGGSIFSGLASAFVGSFDTGTDFVPRTGLAMVHKGERIVPAAENASGGRAVNITLNMQFGGNVDRRTGAQAGVEAGREIQRQLARRTA